MVRSAGDAEACCGADNDMVRAGDAVGTCDGSVACEMATSEESRVELVAAAAAVALVLDDGEGSAATVEAAAGEETPAAAAIADTRSRNVTVACAIDEGREEDGNGKGAATDGARDDAAGN